MVFAATASIHIGDSLDDGRRSRDAKTRRVRVLSGIMTLLKRGTQYDSVEQKRENLSQA